MKKPAFLIAGLMLLTVLVLMACSGPAIPEEESTASPAGANIVSSCINCHSDKDLLKQTAAPVEEEKSEATSGEG